MGYLTKQSDDGSFRIVDGLTGATVLCLGQTPPSTYSSATLESATLETAQSGAGSYAPGNVLSLAGTGTKATLTVTHTQVVSAVVNGAGTGGTPGTTTFTGTTGTGYKFQCTGTIAGDGTLSGALVITNPGDYTINPSNLTFAPITGGGLSSGTVTLIMGVLAFDQTNEGAYTLVAANPLSTTVSPSGGTGCTVVGTFSYTYPAAIPFVLLPSAPPATASSPGTPGSISWDAGFIYICTAPDTWKKAAIASW